MSMTLIAERFNQATWRPSYWPDVSGLRYWKLMTVLRAFRDDHCAACRAARLRLSLLGINLLGARSANLLPPDPQGVPWDSEMAKVVAEAWEPVLRDSGLVVLVGGRVARAFGVRVKRLSEVFGRLVEPAGLMATVIPHPSGLNRFWNEASNVSKLRRRLRRSLSEMTDA